MNKLNGFRSWHLATSAVVIGVLGLGGCGGSTGDTGATGATGAQGPQGAQGPSGTSATVKIAAAQQLTATITSVTVPTSAPVKPVVKFNLVNESGQSVSGLQASSLSLGIAKLVAANTQLAALLTGLTAPQVQNSTQWQSYIYHAASPAASLVPSSYKVTGTTMLPQAGVESGKSGALVDNGDGTYQYTFSTDISAVSNVKYDPTLTHLVGFEIRGVAPANSPTYLFQPSTGATTGITTREIVDDQTCLNCHKGISAHGGARTAVQYCAVCHNPSSYDASTGNTLDFKVMFHKIHMGANLPSVVAGGSYYIAGYMNHVSDYSTINFPSGDLRTCSMCHNESDKNAPDAVGWRNNPGMEPCGSCHDDVDFVNGKNHLGGVTNGECATCHGPNSTITTNSTYKGTLKVADVHVIPELDFQQKIQYQILSVKNSAPGQFPVVNFKVVDPTNGNKAWNVLSDEPFTHCNPATDASLANINLAISWSTTDYTNLGSGNTSESAEPIAIPVTCAATAPVAVGDGSFTVTSTTAVPSGTTGSASAMLQGHPAHEFGAGNYAWFSDCAGAPASTDCANREIPIPQMNAMFWAGITDSTAAPRRTVVDVNKCNGCHYQLNGHGNNRVDSVQMCATCHNPDATDVVARTSNKPPITWANPDPTDGLGEQSIDLKILIHAVHAAPDLAGFAPTATPYVVYHNGSAHNWINSTSFPTPVGSGGSIPTISDCTTCHTNDANGNPTYYPPDPGSSTALASTFNTNGNGPPNKQMAMTAAVAACGACHVTTTAQNHMAQNGGNTRTNPATKDASSKVQSQETCVVCHGQGAIADVASVHKLSTFPD